MAIKTESFGRLKASVTNSKVAAANYRSVEEVMRELRQLQDDLTEADNILKTTRQLTAAGLLFSIDQADMKSSPPVPKTSTLKVKAEDLDGLKKNYTVTRQLYDTLSTLDVMEAKMKASFPEESKEASRAIAEIARMRKSVTDKLSVAFSFLQGLAQSHAPASFVAFTDGVARICERSLSYEESNAYVYLFEEDGELIFSHYIHLKRVMDEEGTLFPDLFVVTSLTTTDPAVTYINTMAEFEPPSKAQLIRKVATLKDVANGLSLLLDMDGFDNAITDLPLNLLVAPKDIKKTMFNSAEYITSIQFDDEAGSLAFHLKPTVKGDSKLLNQIGAQLNLDLQAFLKTTRSKLRMTIKKSSKSYVVVFYMKKPDDAPKATPDDLEFLRTRFRLDDGKVGKMLKVLNASFEKYTPKSKSK